MPADMAQNTDAPLTFHMDLSEVRHDLERARRMETNVSNVERIASGVMGGALMVFGFSRRSIPGALLGALGIALLERGFTGHCNMYEQFGVNTAEE